ALLYAIPAREIPENSLGLDECVKIAVENSVPLDVAHKQIKLAEIRLWESIRKLGPNVKGKWEESGGKVIGRGYEGRKFMMEVSQPFFYGGELFFTVSQAKVNLEIVKNDLFRVRNGIILKVEKSYYSLDKAEKFFGVQQGLNQKAVQLNDAITKGYDMGVVNKLEFLNVASKYSQINFQLVSADEDIALARLMLGQAMNTEEDVYIIPVEVPMIDNGISLADCYTLAYTNRPEIKINYLMTEYYLYENKIKKAHLFPKVDGMGSYGYSAEDFSDPLDRPGRNERLMKPQWYIGLKATMPFFGSTLGYSVAKESWQPVVSAYQGTKSLTNTMTFSILDDLKYYSDVEEAQIGLARAQEEYNKVKQEITLEVKENFFKYKKAIMQMKVAKNKVNYQRTQVSFLDLKREMNEGTASSVLEEMIKLGEEEFSRLQAVADYYISIKSLNKAIGIIGYFDRKDNG
ncbi:MAG: TolC family protein, partial [Candidatus Omnitrophica bacterium]|nr:TolC family protein [Candidatus Omnitrophota bacterium]